MVQNCFTALGDTMSKRFEREGTKLILHSCPRGDPPSCRLQTIAIQQNTFGHFWTPWTLGALHKFHSAYMSLASQVMSQWIKHCYSIGVFDSLALQRQGRLGKTPRLGPRGQFSEARSFHSFNENVALHIMLPSLETNISPEKLMVGRLLSFGEGLFSGAMFCLF